VCAGARVCARGGGAWHGRCGWRGGGGCRWKWGSVCVCGGGDLRDEALERSYNQLKKQAQGGMRDEVLHASAAVFQLLYCVLRTTQHIHVSAGACALVGVMRCRARSYFDAWSMHVGIGTSVRVCVCACVCAWFRGGGGADQGTWGGLCMQCSEVGRWDAGRLLAWEGSAPLSRLTAAPSHNTS
jgi:hypothetical protein